MVGRSIAAAPHLMALSPLAGCEGCVPFVHDEPGVGTYRHLPNEHGLPVGGVRAMAEATFRVPHDYAVAEIRIGSEIDVGDRATIVDRLDGHLDHSRQIGRRHRRHEDLLISDRHTSQRLGAAGHDAVVGRDHHDREGQKCGGSDRNNRTKATRNDGLHDYPPFKVERTG